MPFALDRSSAPPDPPALADYEGGARRALDEARALAGPEGEMRPQPTTEGMSSQLLQKAGGASPRTRVALPRQRRPLHEHPDPEATFMREFEVRPGPRVASRASVASVAMRTDRISPGVVCGFFSPGTRTRSRGSRRPGGWVRDLVGPGGRWRRARALDARDGWNEFRSVRFVRARVVVVARIADGVVGVVPARDHITRTPYSKNSKTLGLFDDS